VSDEHLRLAFLSIGRHIHTERWLTWFARRGHDVHLFEKFAKAGGLLRYGIPDFKMEKGVIDLRVRQMEGEGVTFHYGAHVGVNLPAEKLLADYDAVVLAGGAEKGRDLPIPGRELDGIHFAMDFLPQQNRRVSGEPQDDGERCPAARRQAAQDPPTTRRRVRAHVAVPSRTRGSAAALAMSETSVAPSVATAESSDRPRMTG